MGLNNKVCNKCKSIHYKKEVPENFTIINKGKVTVFCHMAKKGYGIERVAVVNEPPKDCPYVLEHMVNNVK